MRRPELDGWWLVRCGWELKERLLGRLGCKLELKEGQPEEAEFEFDGVGSRLLIGDRWVRENGCAVGIAA